MQEYNNGNNFDFETLAGDFELTMNWIPLVALMMYVSSAQCRQIA